jgi:hypothetical protein
VFETPASRAPQPRLVLTALLAGSLLFLGIALGVGPLGSDHPSTASLVWLGVGGALLAPALGVIVGERLRGATASPDADAAERPTRAARALIVEDALCEAVAMLGGVAVLLHGPDWRLLGALVVPLGRLLVLRQRAGEPAAPA